MEQLFCGDCSLGKTERVVGNGITEPPYLHLVRCPFEDEYYLYPNNECKHNQQRLEKKNHGT